MSGWTAPRSTPRGRPFRLRGDGDAATLIRFWGRLSGMRATGAIKLPVIALMVVGLLAIGGGAWGQAGSAKPATTRPATAASATRQATTTRATTRATATTRTTTRAADPLATPESAVVHLFGLMRERDVNSVRMVLFDPPPSEKLRSQIELVARRLSRGAKFDLIETKIEKNAAAVLYRTTFPSGKVDVSPVVLIRRYDRWKAILGDFNPRRYTSGEKEDLAALTRWMQQRLPELSAASTQPAPVTQPTATTQRTAPAGSPPP